jgi:hypothetical protein
MKLLFAFSLIVILASGVLAQNRPSYADYAVSVETKTAKEIILASHPLATEFRTNIINAFTEEDVNFAGKYVLTQWGCGTACVEAALIDGNTGRVFMPVILQGVTQGYNPAFAKHNILEFKKNSKLLIIYG